MKMNVRNRSSLTLVRIRGLPGHGIKSSILQCTVKNFQFGLDLDFTSDVSFSNESYPVRFYDELYGF